MTQSDASPSRDAFPPNRPPRFSLFTLMVVVTICAGVFGLTRIVGNIVFVWIAAAETAGVVVGLVLGFFAGRVKRSVVGACAGAALTTGVPLVFIVATMIGFATKPVWLGADALGLGTAISIAFVGALGGVVGGAVGAFGSKRRPPEEIGILWGAGTGAAVVLLPYAIVFGSGVGQGEVSLGNFCLGVMVALCLTLIAANVGGIAGVIIASFVRLFLGDRRSMRKRREYKINLPPELKDN